MEMFVRYNDEVWAFVLESQAEFLHRKIIEMIQDGRAINR